MAGSAITEKYMLLVLRTKAESYSYEEAFLAGRKQRFGASYYSSPLEAAQKDTLLPGHLNLSSYVIAVDAKTDETFFTRAASAYVESVDAILAANNISKTPPHSDAASSVTASRRSSFGSVSSEEKTKDSYEDFRKKHTDVLTKPYHLTMKMDDFLGPKKPVEPSQREATRGEDALLFAMSMNFLETKDSQQDRFKGQNPFA
jgi:hypothetical protein